MFGDSANEQAARIRGLNENPVFATFRFISRHATAIIRDASAPLSPPIPVSTLKYNCGNYEAVLLNRDNCRQRAKRGSSGENAFPTRCRLPTSCPRYLTCLPARWVEVTVRRAYFWSGAVGKGNEFIEIESIHLPLPRGILYKLYLWREYSPCNFFRL